MITLSCYHDKKLSYFFLWKLQTLCTIKAVVGRSCKEPELQYKLCIHYWILHYRTVLSRRKRLSFGAGEKSFFLLGADENAVLLRKRWQTILLIQRFSVHNFLLFQISRCFPQIFQCVKFSGKKNMITCYHDTMITLSW
jgi:hypothetical protein